MSTLSVILIFLYIIYIFFFILQSVDFVATAHSAYIIIFSPDPASDVVLQIIKDGREEKVPLKAKKQDNEYVYEYTLFLGEVSNVNLI